MIAITVRRLTHMVFTVTSICAILPAIADAQLPCEGQWEVLLGPRPRATPAVFHVEQGPGTGTFLLGGRGEGEGPLSDLWTLTDAGWHEVVLSGPRPAAGSAVWDPSRSAVVFHDLNGVTWRFDGLAWIHIAVGGPRTRIFDLETRLLFDSIRSRLLLYVGGGIDEGIWAFVGTRWERIGDTFSSIYSGGGVVYHPGRDSILLFGGRELGSGDEGVDDLWEYRLDLGFWDRLPMTDPWPGRRYGHAMYYDADRDVVIVSGGESSILLSSSIRSYSVVPDMWEWDGEAWQSRGFAPGNAGMIASWSSAFGAVLAGGYQSRYNFDQEATERFYESESYSRVVGPWTLIKPSPQPKTLPKHRMGFHQVLGRAIATGGNYFDPFESEIVSVRSAERYDRFGRFEPMDSLSEGRAGHAMAYDALRNELVVFGGSGFGGMKLRTTELLGADGQWVFMGSSAAAARDSHAMAWDPKIERVLMYGGSAADLSVWAWDGANWEPLPGQGPSLGTWAAMAFDEQAQAMLVVGQDGASWYFDSTAPLSEAWRSTNAEPIPQQLPGLVRIPGYGVVASGRDGLSGQVLRWTGSHWARVSSTPVLGYQDLAYDEVLGALVFSSQDDWAVAHWTPPCLVDLNCDGLADLFDFLAFQNLFAMGDPVADFDGDGDLTLFDFLAFQNAFDAGCA